VVCRAKEVKLEVIGVWKKGSFSLQRLLSKQLNLYPKLILSFLVVLAPVYVISLMMNNYAEKNVREKIDESMRSYVHFYIRQLESEFNRINRMQEEFINDRDVRILSSAGETLTELDWRNAIIRIRNRLVTLRNLNNYVRNASIYLPKEKRLISSAAAYEQLSEDEYEALKKVSRQTSNSFVYDKGRLFISFPYSNLALINGREPLFLISAEIESDAVSEVLNSIRINGSGGAFVVGRDSSWVLRDKSSNPELTQSMMDGLTQSKASGEAAADPGKRKVQSLIIGGETYWVCVEESQKLGFSLAVYMPEKQMLGSLKQYRVWFWMLSVISVLIVILFSYWIHLQIHQPLRRLIHAFRSLENGVTNEVLVYNRSDEFGYLYVQYNKTAKRIKELIHEVYEQKFRANLSELRQLQSQINPHFLYNNFFILYRMAKNEENENIANFTSYLGRYFQFITRTQKGTIRLEEETAFSRTYVDIQSFRFEDRIVVRFAELPKELADLEVPKLILQPIIENVYQHGLRDTLEDGLLEVRFERDGGRLDIVVEDNGEAMPEVDFEELRRKLEASSGWTADVETTGIVNVHRRLRLEFGDEGGVEFSRRPGGGNRAVLSIPLARNNEQREANSEGSGE
jgi:two-component system sensor histidine kinase YesM